MKKMTDRITKYSLLVLLVFLFGCKNEHENKNGVVESYKPSKPITFPHTPHSQIDCKYCHNSIDNSKNTNLQGGGVCLNCHIIKKRNLKMDKEEYLDEITSIITNQSDIQLKQ